MSEVTTGVTNYALVSMGYYKQQRDKLVECLRAMVDGTTTYEDEDGYITCVYCDGWVNYQHRDNPILHNAGCVYLLAQTVLAEIEAQIDKEVK